MARRARPSLRQQIQRRKRVWARQQVVSDDIGQVGTAFDLGAGFQLAMDTNHLPVGITIGGVVLDFTCSRVVAGTDVTDSQLQYGVICVDEPDQLEVPRPLSEPHADWMWQQQISFPVVTAGTTVSTFNTLGGAVHIKARRKCEELGSHLYLVFQGSDITPTYDVNVMASTLLMLP